MKKVLLAAGALALLLGFQAPVLADDDHEHHFTIKNETQDAIKEISIRAHGEGDYVPLVDSAGEAHWAAGASDECNLEGDLAEHCDYDYKVTDDEGKEWEGEMTLCDGENYRQKLEIELKMDGDKMVATHSAE
jgi:hypothetical protein